MVHSSREAAKILWDSALKINNSNLITKSPPYTTPEQSAIAATAQNILGNYRSINEYQNPSAPASKASPPAAAAAAAAPIATAMPPFILQTANLLSNSVTITSSNVTTGYRTFDLNSPEANSKESQEKAKSASMHAFEKEQVQKSKAHSPSPSRRETTRREVTSHHGNQSRSASPVRRERDEKDKRERDYHKEREQDQQIAAKEKEAADRSAPPSATTAAVAIPILSKEEQWLESCHDIWDEPNLVSNTIKLLVEAKKLNPLFLNHQQVFFYQMIARCLHEKGLKELQVVDLLDIMFSLRIKPTERMTFILTDEIAEFVIAKTYEGPKYLIIRLNKIRNENFQEENLFYLCQIFAHHFKKHKSLKITMTTLNTIVWIIKRNQNKNENAHFVSQIRENYDVLLANVYHEFESGEINFKRHIHIYKLAYLGIEYKKDLLEYFKNSNLKRYLGNIIHSLLVSFAGDEYSLFRAKAILRICKQYMKHFDLQEVDKAMCTLSKIYSQLSIAEQEELKKEGNAALIMLRDSIIQNRSKFKDYELQTLSIRMEVLGISLTGAPAKK